jgi:hypothetical protein
VLATIQIVAAAAEGSSNFLNNSPESVKCVGAAKLLDAARKGMGGGGVESATPRGEEGAVPNKEATREEFRADGLEAGEVL